MQTGGRCSVTLAQLPPGKHCPERTVASCLVVPLTPPDDHGSTVPHYTECPMRLPACLTLVLLAAATACASVTDEPTSPLIQVGNTSNAITSLDDGEPPPPPIDTAGAMLADGASFQFNAVYFENKQNANSWLAFQSSAGVIASPSARLMYNPRTLRTKGVGTLTVGTKVIELQFVSITTALGFAACPTPTEVTPLSTSDGPACKVEFTYNGTAGSYLFFQVRRGA